VLVACPSPRRFPKPGVIQGDELFKLAIDNRSDWNRDILAGT